MLNEIINGDCLKVMKGIADGSIDCILTDPPYKYLSNQKLEIDFDENEFFNEAKRVLKKDGIIILFGRGTSFYRWNTTLALLGFKFKEEIIWDKSLSSSPISLISRVHETVSIHAKGKGIINKVKVPYTEMKAHNLDSIITDVKRLKSALNNTNSLNALIDYLESNKVDYNVNTGGSRFRTTFQSKVNNSDKGAQCFNAIVKGMNEKTIIKIPRDHYGTIHPTQKPVRLFERLLELTTKPGDIVLDTFSGSGVTALACVNTDRNFIGVEIDAEYYNASIERLNKHTAQLRAA